MFSKLNIRLILWLLIVFFYGLLVTYKAVAEHAFIYDNTHYENAVNAMDQESRDIYFRQKCNTFDLSSNEPEPICYSLPTVDSGTMYFDATTPRAAAEKVLKSYNKVSQKYVALAVIKFVTFFMLLWLIPSFFLYPFWEWFLDGYIKDSNRSLNLISAKTTDAVTVRRIENLITRYLQYLEERGKIFNFLLGLGFSILFGIFDAITPSQYSFILLYFFPVALTTWFAGQSAGFFITVLCTFFWARANLQVDLLSFTSNILSTLSVFFILSIMITRLRQMWEKENLLSRTDQLTGVMNRRGFDEIVEYEILSLNRQNSPFSLAYLDLDNFKEVNDRFGHKKGDELLKAVVTCLAENLRRTDLIARLGGDEFTIFFPATDQNAVKLVMLKVREQLHLLSEKNNWPISFSIGVITSVDSKCELEEIISLADKLMYEVKKSGKDDVQYVTVPPGT